MKPTNQCPMTTSSFWIVNQSKSQANNFQILIFEIFSPELVILGITKISGGGGPFVFVNSFSILYAFVWSTHIVISSLLCL